jgi:hypothetical protein
MTVSPVEFEVGNVEYFTLSFNDTVLFLPYHCTCVQWACVWISLSVVDLCSVGLCRDKPVCSGSVLGGSV